RNFLPTLIDQHRPLHLHRHMRDWTSDDRPRRSSHVRPCQRSDLLHFPWVDPYSNIAHSASRSKVIPSHGCHMGSVYVGDVSDIGDVHDVHVRSLDVHTSRLPHVRYVYPVD